MSHLEQISFFRLAMQHFPEVFSGRVIDIGSLDINGGPHKDLECQEYVGVDVAAGPNVTLVSRGEDVNLPSESFDVSMSSECFEHNPSWRETLDNMIRMTKPLGLVVFTCASVGRLEHGTTRSDLGYAAPLTVGEGQEYYKNVSRLMLLRSLSRSSFLAFRVFSNFNSGDLYFLGVKAASSADTREDSKKLMLNLDGFEAQAKSYVRKENQKAIRRLPLITLGRLYQKFYFSPGYKLVLVFRRCLSRSR